MLEESPDSTACMPSADGLDVISPSASKNWRPLLPPGELSEEPLTLLGGRWLHQHTHICRYVGRSVGRSTERYVTCAHTL